VRSLEAAQQRIEQIRRRAYTGSAIRMHRAIASVHLRRRDLAAVLVLPPLFDILIVWTANPLVSAWSFLIDWWRVRVGMPNPVIQWPADFGAFTLWLPNILLEEALPTPVLWWSTLVICVALWIGAGWIAPQRFLPLAYITRALVLIQGSALAFVGLFPASFPFETAHYLARSLAGVFALMLVVPWLLAAVYNIFDFAFWKKALLSALTLVYLAVFAPIQYLLQIVIIWKGTGLFLPVLYICFGTVLEIVILLGLYSWAMTWGRPPR
jgi:hypothetical protein